MPFIGRGDIAETFATAARAHLAAVDSGAAFSTEPRRNVFAIYGAPGIGKSRMLRQLEAWLLSDAGAAQRLTRMT